jgi:hypothetical protein
MQQPLPEIRVVDLGNSGFDRLAELTPGEVKRFAAAGRSMLSAPVFAFMDWRSRAWLARNVTPYRDEVARIAAIPGVTGVHALNLSTEWACSTMVNGGRLIRTLDWPLHGLGSGVTVVRHDSPCGAWWQATWPGFVGTLTAMAPGRFAAAYNQPPVRRQGFLKPLDWLSERIRVNRRTSLPPTHLLREVFESAGDFNEALRLLRDTPLAMPALFSLTGAGGESVVIERLETRARLRPGPTAIANHWPDPPGHGACQAGWPSGWPRGVDSPGRFRDACRLADTLTALPQDFSWLRYPVLNKFSRLAVMTDCVAGTLIVLGLEQSGNLAAPATRILRLDGLKTTA